MAKLTQRSNGVLKVVKRWGARNDRKQRHNIAVVSRWDRIESIGTAFVFDHTQNKRRESAIRSPYQRRNVSNNAIGTLWLCMALALRSHGVLCDV